MLLLGHCFGDYLLQSQWLAENKKKSIAICHIHCAIYTFCVFLFLLCFARLDLKWYHVLLIYGSHIILDATTLLDKWMRFCGIRSWDTGLPKVNGKVDFNALVTVKDAVQVSFGAFVYAVADNTLHITLMILILKITGVI